MIFLEPVHNGNAQCNYIYVDLRGRLWHIIGILVWKWTSAGRKRAFWWWWEENSLLHKNAFLYEAQFELWSYTNCCWVGVQKYYFFRALVKIMKYLYLPVTWGPRPYWWNFFKFYEVNNEFLFQTEVKDWVCWQNSSHNFLHKTTLTFEMFFLWKFKLKFVCHPLQARDAFL